MKELLSACLFLALLLCYSVEVKSADLKIIDGDTIILDGEKIRFSGIDTPELKQTCEKGNQIIFCGILAKDFLVKKIGNKIPICIKEGKDIYKRFLAECFVNGDSLSRFLVRNGFAFAFIKYSKKYVKDEKYAKKRKLGIWSMKFEHPWEFRKTM